VGKQLNKVQKRARRKRYNERLKERERAAARGKKRH